MKRRLNKFYFIAIFAGLLLSFRLQAQQIIRNVKETLLSKIDKSKIIDDSYTFSNNMKRIAFCMKADDNKQIAVIDGVKGSPYEKVNMPYFSPDSKYFTYSAFDGKKWLWVTGEKYQTAIDSSSTIVFQIYSPDNKTIAYVKNDSNKFYLLFNGIKSKLYDAIDYNSITFSNDAHKVAFSASINKKQLIVFDGKEGAYCDKVGFPIISHDGKRLGYWAVINNRYLIIVDNTRSKNYEKAGSLQFSENSKHFAYQAVRANKQIIILDSTESEMYELAHSLCLSPDGSKLAFGIEVPKKTNNEEEFTQYVVLNGKKSEVYETVVEGTLKFSSDSKTLIYKAETHDAFFIVSNGKLGKRYSDVLQSTVVFSPDNHHFAYAGENDSKRYVNLDTVEGKPYQDIFSIAFSPDSRRVAYSAKLANQQLVVMDGINGKNYDLILGLGQVFFDSPDTFHYMAQKGNDIFLVEEKIEVK